MNCGQLFDLISTSALGSACLGVQCQLQPFGSVDAKQNCGLLRLLKIVEANCKRSSLDISTRHISPCPSQINNFLVFAASSVNILQDKSSSIYVLSLALTSKLSKTSTDAQHASSCRKAVSMFRQPAVMRGIKQPHPEGEREHSCMLRSFLSNPLPSYQNCLCKRQGRRVRLLRVVHEEVQKGDEQVGCDQLSAHQPALATPLIQLQSPFENSQHE